MSYNSETNQYSENTIIVVAVSISISMICAFGIVRTLKPPVDHIIVQVTATPALQAMPQPTPEPRVIVVEVAPAEDNSVPFGQLRSDNDVIFCLGWCDRTGANIAGGP